jgi:hypothetical protein
MIVLQFIFEQQFILHLFFKFSSLPVTYYDVLCGNSIDTSRFTLKVCLSVRYSYDIRRTLHLSVRLERQHLANPYNLTKHEKGHVLYQNFHFIFKR